MKLEQQLTALAELGLTLNPGVTVDDLLNSWDREEYENAPFDTILFMLGSEAESPPWGRNFCDRAWNFDLESIEGDGSYVTIVENLCRIASQPELITELEDSVDIDNGEAWLKYKIGGEDRYFAIAVDGDWADPESVSKVMQDIERNGRRFYGKDNGQASIWFYLDNAMADSLNRLTGNKLSTNG